MPSQTGPNTYEERPEYLASGRTRLGTVTIDTSLFTNLAADDNGRIVLLPGMLLARTDTVADVLWGEYDALASDGRETVTNNLLICHSYADITDDIANSLNREITVLLEGQVIPDKVITTAGVAADATEQAALQSLICDVKFRIEAVA